MRKLPAVVPNSRSDGRLQRFHLPLFHDWLNYMLFWINTHRFLLSVLYNLYICISPWWKNVNGKYSVFSVDSEKCNLIHTSTWIYSNVYPGHPKHPSTIQLQTNPAIGRLSAEDLKLIRSPNLDKMAVCCSLYGITSWYHHPTDNHSNVGGNKENGKYKYFEKWKTCAVIKQINDTTIPVFNWGIACHFAQLFLFITIHRLLVE